MGKVDDTTLISQAEYARHRGCSREAVRRKVESKQIDAFGPEKMISPQLADAQWRQRVRARADSARGAAAGPPPTDVPTAPEETPGSEHAYSVSRARRERYEADLAQLKLLEQQGELVRIAEVHVVIGRRLGNLRASLLAIPARLAPLLAPETDQVKVHTALDNEIRSVLLANVRDE